MELLSLSVPPTRGSRHPSIIISMNRDEVRRKTRQLLETVSTEDISYLFGRYCGPGNEMLSQKKFGFVLDLQTVCDEVFTRQFETQISAEFENALSETPDKIEE